MIRKILKLVNKNVSSKYIKRLKKAGVKIGEGTVFYDPNSNVVDVSRPKLLTIGKNVRITHGVIILNHDYSWSVLTGVYGEILGGVAPTTIGDNVFIGMNSIILKGTTIGDNVIIGAGSIVTCDIPSNEVWAGNPARRISTLDEFYNKRRIRSLKEFETICKAFSADPEMDRYIHEYEPMFEPFEGDNIENLARATGYFDKAKEYYESHERPYSNLEEVFASMKEREKNE